MHLAQNYGHFRLLHDAFGGHPVANIIAYDPHKDGTASNLNDANSNFNLHYFQILLILLLCDGHNLNVKSGI